jgi:hypothetical protein
MAQIFNRSTNTIAKATIYGGVFIAAFFGWIFMVLDRSSYNTGQGIVVQQPVPFSHDHHTAGLGIDCRYCHTTVETSAYAGIPPTATCMNCHKQIWTNADLLEPVRASWRENKPIQWQRIHDLPDFAYFNHSIHIARGVSCFTCHGNVTEMPLIYQAQSLQMEWCLDCHRNPEKYIRPVDQVFNPNYLPVPSQEVVGARLVQELGIQKLDTCSTCHR